MKMSCDYCLRDAELVTGKEIYPHRPDLHKLPFYRCRPCKAYVGCHKGTTVPMGRMANAELRAAKTAAHAAFDPLWREGVLTSRRHAYRWLADKMGLREDQCHIGQFDVKQCEQVQRIVKRDICDLPG